MIFLGKLLENTDLKILFYVNDVLVTYDRDVLNSVCLLNRANCTLNTFTTHTTQGLKPFDPYFVSYTIFDKTHGYYEIMRPSAMNGKPMRKESGYYWVPIKIDPRFFRVGKYIVEWQFKQYFDSEMESSTEEFDITTPAAYSGEFCTTMYAKSGVFPIREAR